MYIVHCILLTYFFQLALVILYSSLSSLDRDFANLQIPKFCSVGYLSGNPGDLHIDTCKFGIILQCWVFVRQSWWSIDSLFANLESFIFCSVGYRPDDRSGNPGVWGLLGWLSATLLLFLQAKIEIRNTFSNQIVLLCKKAYIMALPEYVTSFC